MLSYSTNEFHSGLKIMFNGEPYSIIENEFVKPGKSQAFNRVRLRNLISGKILEKTFKSGFTVEAANIIDITLTYLYKNGKFWHFMNTKNFEQITADVKAVGDNAKWLVEQSKCILTLWDNKPIAVIPPKFVNIKIIKTDPGIKGDTTVAGSKIAILTTGAVVKVPLFVQIGEVIKVDTRSGEYVFRIK